MKVQVKDLKPNPYRNMDKYPVDRMKVDALKASISETTFWDNIVARQQNGSYQIAYGHHRLIALQELNIKKVDIPVRKLDNSTMVRIMANENMEYWKFDDAVKIETIRAVRDFINTEIRKYNSWKELKHINETFYMLFIDFSKDPEYWIRLKNQGVGWPIILKFLGKPWKQYSIQKALEVLDGEETDIKIAKAFGNTSVRSSFKKSIGEIKEQEPRRDITKEKELEVAKKVKTRIDSFKGRSKDKKVHGMRRSFEPTMKTMIKQELDGKSNRDMEIENILLEIQNILYESGKLFRTISSINDRLGNMKVERIKNMQFELTTLDKFSDLIGSINRLMNFFGTKINIKEE